MSKYTVLFHKNTEKELRKIPNKDRIKVFEKIDELAEDPFIQGHIKLSGYDDLYRVRQGNYRIIYTVENGELKVHVIKVQHRKDVYRK